MPGYLLKSETVTVGGDEFLICGLLDTQQFADPDGVAAAAGITSTDWALFGKVWPSARVLALAMQDFDIAGKRILEVGAGLGLASLVIHRRAGDMTVSDWHPLGQRFLDENLRLNRLGPMPYRTGDWAIPDPGLGRFDLIIGSDVLYERQQPELLANFIDRHSADSVEVLIVDPDRGNRADFCRAMARRDYEFSSWQAERRLENGAPYKGRFLRFAR